MAALAFVSHVRFRPVIHTTPLPSWIAPVGHTLLSLPVVGLTCRMQLGLMASTVHAAYGRHLPAVYPLLAQLTGWCAFTMAVAACCERTRYAVLSGAIAVPVSFAAIAIATYTPAIKRVLATPPATPHAVTVGWYTITSAALVLTGLAIRDQWQRYTRRLHL